METLTEPAPTFTEHDTDPLPVVRSDSPEKCGFEDCGKPAYPMTYCRDCHMPLCPAHAELVLTRRIDASVVCCPRCAKGAN